MTRFAVMLFLLSMTAFTSAVHADAESDAIDALKKVGATILRDEKDATKPVVNVIFKSGPAPLTEVLPHLAAFPKLHALSFPYVKGLNDEGAVHLAKLDQLKSLTLVGTSLSDKGMKSLAKLTNLERLEMASTPIGDEGLQYLADMTKLRFLGLNATNVTGPGIEHLSKLQALEQLDMFNTPMTDAGLEFFIPLKKLVRLDLNMTCVSDEAVKTLRDARPDLKIQANPIPKALTDIQGEWKLESLTIAGKVIENPGDRTFTIRGKMGGTPFPRLGFRVFQFDPSKNPKTVDSGFEGKESFNAEMLGIYRWENETLTLCLAKSKKDRPTEFTSTAENGFELRVYKRSKK